MPAEKNRLSQDSRSAAPAHRRQPNMKIASRKNAKTLRYAKVFENLKDLFIISFFAPLRLRVFACDCVFELIRNNFDFRYFYFQPKVDAYAQSG